MAGIASNVFNGARGLEDARSDGKSKDDCGDDGCKKPDPRSQKAPLLLTRFVTEPIEEEDEKEDDEEGDEEDGESDQKEEEEEDESLDFLQNFPNFYSMAADIMNQLDGQIPEV